MPQIASEGFQGIQDFSALTELVQPEYNLLEKLDLFEVEYVDVDTVSMERIEDGVDAIVAKQRGGERNYANRENARREILEIPFFPLDVVIKAAEILDFRKFLEGDQSESLLNRVTRAVKRIRKSHDRLKRSAMYACLNGSTYTGVTNHKANKSFATIWGVTGNVAANVDFTALTTNPAAAFETARAGIQSAAQDEAAGYEIVALCGSQYFNAYYDHPLVNDDMFGDNDKQVERLGANLVERSFKHKGVTFLLDASGQIPTGQCRIVPLGIADMFKMTYGPSDTLKGSEEEIKDVYTFAIEAPRKMVIETETAFLCHNTRPELIYNSTGVFA